MKKEVIFGAILLIFVVFTSARSNNVDDDDDVDFDLFETPLTRRSHLNRYHAFKQRETSTFTEVQRKFQNDALNTHNILRAHHCAPPLTLDDEINAKAQAYAEKLATADNGLVHSTDRHGLLGESLYLLVRTIPITDPDGM